MGDVLPIGSGAVNYSYDEQVIGTWVDGKPLYQKTISCGTMPNSTQKEVSHNISDLGFVVNISGCGYNSGDKVYQDLPIVQNSDVINYQMRVRVTTTNIQFKSNANCSDFTETYITLQYTKTTD